MTQTAAPSAGRELVAADEGETLGDRRVGRDDDRLGRHQAARGVGRVGEQEAHVVGLLGLHELEQGLAALLRQLRDEVGGVVRLHLVEHVGGAVVVELGDQVDLVVLGHLLERVGEPVVGELLGHLEAALLRQVEQRGGEVGGQQVGVGGDELLGRLGLARLVSSRASASQSANSVAPLPNGAAPTRGRRRKSSPTSHSPGPISSIATSSMVASPERSRSVDLAAEQFGDDPHLAAALLEAAQVDEAGGDDLARADARDAADRQEDAAASRGSRR